MIYLQLGLFGNINSKIFFIIGKKNINQDIYYRLPYIRIYFIQIPNIKSIKLFITYHPKITKFPIWNY